MRTQQESKAGNVKIQIWRLILCKWQTEQIAHVAGARLRYPHGLNGRGVWIKRPVRSSIVKPHFIPVRLIELPSMIQIKHYRLDYGDEGYICLSNVDRKNFASCGQTLIWRKIDEGAGYPRKQSRQNLLEKEGDQNDNERIWILHNDSGDVDPRSTVVLQNKVSVNFCRICRPNKQNDWWWKWHLVPKSWNPMRYHKSTNEWVFLSWSSRDRNDNWIQTEKEC